MKNYIHYTFGLAFLVVLMIFGLQYIPSEAIREAGLKPVDISADLLQHGPEEQSDRCDAERSASENALSFDGTFIRSDPGSVQQLSVEKDTLFHEEHTESVNRPRYIPVWDYSPDGDMLDGFVEQLSRIGQLQRPIRVGFMGDSFIEGDLLTADFRELMQEKYGGGGVGFVPITSQVAGFRQTVLHKFGDWKQQSILQYKDGGDFTISAFVFTPLEGNYVEYKAPVGRPHLDRFGRTRLLFVSKGHSVIRVTVNGQKELLFETEPKETLQEIRLDGDFRSIRYQVDNVEGFTAYGVYLENPTGVSVDNFSVRGNAGTVMDRISPVLSGQFDDFSPYDLLVLQYGLNVVSGDVTDFSMYRRQMIQVVNHIKQCFPGVAILVMSVGDRATQMNGEFVTKPGIQAMVAEQQKVAHECGVLFWNMYDAMQSAGGMRTFVKNGWAAKDYTHISAQGGRKIATALFEAITREP